MIQKFNETSFIILLLLVLFKNYAKQTIDLHPNLTKVNNFFNN